MIHNYTMPTSARDFMYKVYGWMSVALAATAAIAYYIGSTPAMYTPILQNKILFFGIMIAQLAIVVFLQWKIKSLTYTEAVIAFLSYAALTGITLSTIFLVYTMASIYTAFLITAGLFAIMSAYGYLTNADLSSMGSFLVMGLFGIILAMFVNMWFQSPLANYYISLVAVGIFTLLTAYDVQKLKRLAESMMVDPETKQKMAIIGALTLYLDFINLFLNLLQVMGKKRD